MGEKISKASLYLDIGLGVISGIICGVALYLSTLQKFNYEERQLRCITAIFFLIIFIFEIYEVRRDRKLLDEQEKEKNNDNAKKT